MTDSNQLKDISLTNDNDNRASSTASSDFDRLEDCNEEEFRGATLSLSQDTEMSSPTPDVPASDISRAHKKSNIEDATNANVGQQTNHSTPDNSRRSSTLRPLDGQALKDFFAIREGAFEQATEQCRPVLLENLDGEFKGKWLLTEIDHWDTEKERIAFVTEKSLIIMKYDFITLRLLDYKRISLKQIDRVIVGELKYPENSLMPARNQLGVQCLWNGGQPLPFIKRWNPWCREIPWVTYTSHPLFKYEGANKVNYDIEQFSKVLVQCYENLISPETSPTADGGKDQKGREVSYQPIIIESYAGIAAALHNANDLGFFKSRGKVSF